MGLRRAAHLLTTTPTRQQERENMINEAQALRDTASDASHRGDTATHRRATAAADRLMDHTRPVE